MMQRYDHAVTHSQPTSDNNKSADCIIIVANEPLTFCERAAATARPIIDRIALVSDSDTRAAADGALVMAAAVADSSGFSWFDEAPVIPFIVLLDEMEVEPNNPSNSSLVSPERPPRDPAPDDDDEEEVEEADDDEVEVEPDDEDAAERPLCDFEADVVDIELEEDEVVVEALLGFFAFFFAVFSLADSVMTEPSGLVDVSV